MPRVKAFHALRPPVELAEQVASVPYDVVNRSEAAELARGNPHSFLHVVRPDIDLPAETAAYDEVVYATAKLNLERLIAEGTLQSDDAECIFLYRQIMNGQSQVGLVCCSHVDDYENNLILKHEKTRPAKEDDRTRHLLTLNAHTGPVFLTYRDSPDVSALVEVAVKDDPLYDFTAPDGIQHTVWRISQPAAYIEALSASPYFYVADGHHRAASAWRAATERKNQNRNHTGNEEYNWFLTVLFPASELRILAYNRIVRDLNGHSAAEIRESLAAIGELSPTSDAVPSAAGSFCIYLNGQWYTFTIPADSIDSSDPIASLDVALLEDRVLRPILGIQDVRTDPRIDFVGGIRGTGELKRLVDSGEWACAFSMYPTSIEQLMSVADAGQVMPPKSTWFEPKLRSGLFVHELG
jgi:uncharacterized protein (DUF1015 family)